MRKTTCLKGYVGGSRFDNPGAVVNPLCLARDPEWGIYQDGVSEYKSYIFGAEFETAGSSMGSVHNYDVPCAVCLTQNRSVVKMFPGEVPTLNKINLIIINQPYRKKK